MAKIVEINRVGVRPVQRNLRNALRIAALVPSDVELFDTIGCGMREAKRELAALGVTVDIISPNIKEYFIKRKELLANCLNNNYQGVVLSPFIDDMDDFLIKCKSNKIAVMMFNNDVSNKALRLTCIRQDAYQSAYKASALFADHMNKKGRILVIMQKGNDYTARLKGFQAGLQRYRGMQILDTYYLSNDIDDSDDYTELTDCLNRYKGQFDAVFCLGSGQAKLGKALLKNGMAHKVFAVIYDVDATSIESLRNGALDYAIGQDPLTQGRDAVIHLYNYIEGNEQLDSEIIPTEIQFFSSEDGIKMAY